MKLYIFQGKEKKHIYDYDYIDRDKNLFLFVSYMKQPFRCI